jgi:hypothetical protein
VIVDAAYDLSVPDEHEVYDPVIGLYRGRRPAAIGRGRFHLGERPSSLCRFLGPRRVRTAVGDPGTGARSYRHRADRSTRENPKGKNVPT